MLLPKDTLKGLNKSMQTPKPWVSFCISTFKRPLILEKQLLLLSQQTFTEFEVVVSDNDPEESARSVVAALQDPRFRYFHNSENLGMIKSFNKSIERSTAEFIVMVTDDDPVAPDFLSVFYSLYQQNPNCSIYCGFIRNGKEDGSVELMKKDDFLLEVLDPAKTSNFLWSSAIVRKTDAIKIGLIPDYGSPHLADHAFIASAGAVQGGVIMNKMFSSLSKHDANFSKFNFQYYVLGCEGFYNYMQPLITNHPRTEDYKKIVSKHLGTWFIACMAALKKYYTLTKKTDEVKKVETCAAEILKFPYMRKFRARYFIKNRIFFIKKSLGLLK